MGFELRADNRSINGAFLHPDRPPSVRPSEEISSRHAVAVPESYGIDEFRDARRRRQSRWPEVAGSSLVRRVLTVG